MDSLDFCDTKYLLFWAKVKCPYIFSLMRELRARDLIFFATDLQTVNYYSTLHFIINNLYIEIIYNLGNNKFCI